MFRAMKKREISPRTARTNDVFLHVIQVGGHTLDGMDLAEPIRTADSARVRLKIGSRTWEIAFTTEGDLGGRIKLTGDTPSL